MPTKKSFKSGTKQRKHQLKLNVRESEVQHRTAKDVVNRDRGEADPRKNPKGRPPKRS